MRLTKNAVETTLLNYHPRTTVGDNQNPLRRVFLQLGYTPNTTTPPKWLTEFLQRTQNRSAKTISAKVALTLLNS